MKFYTLQDPLHFKKESTIPLESEAGEQIGEVGRFDHPEYEKNHAFFYRSADAHHRVSVGIRKGGLKRFVAAEYGVDANGIHYALADKLGHSLLYFCVTGTVEGQSIRIEENWSREVEVQADGCLVACIQRRDFRALFQFEDSVKETSALFALSVLMYFMLKIYNEETAFIQELLLD